MEGLAELLQSLSDQSQRLVRRLAAYRDLLSDPVNNVHARAKAIAQLSGAIQAFPDSEVRQKLVEWHRNESAAIEQSRSEFRFEFGRQFVAGLEGSGMTVKGQLPLLRVGLFTVRVDFEAGSATIFWGPEIEKLKSGLALAPLELATTLRKWNERLRQKSVEPSKLAGRLHAAYRRFCGLEGLSEGTRVFLLDLLSELVLLMQPESFRLNPAQEKFVEYPRVRFSYDLFRLKQAGAFSVGEVQLKLHVANFDATTEKAKALWVPDSEEGDGTHYSYISFSK
ncbi:hypothetical protein FJY68_10995 [candidate division WOR-3 bacterium]|uniref:Uncharacterized protein n=1 Tax=candidate division WOR-3 bacterium TaxID=2052148 RepID=A0A938BUU5_UNCW3|nr:hypothetical protein [candidate division WOR-3 bacterium]